MADDDKNDTDETSTLEDDVTNPDSDPDDQPDGPANEGTPDGDEDWFADQDEPGEPAETPSEEVVTPSTADAVAAEGDTTQPDLASQWAAYKEANDEVVANLLEQIGALTSQWAQMQAANFEALLNDDSGPADVADDDTDPDIDSYDDIYAV